MDLKKVRIINFQKVPGLDSELFVYDSKDKVPFVIKRSFCIKAKKNIKRGEHAHIKCKQLLICLSGKIKVNCRDKIEEKEYMLSEPELGILVPPMIWCSQEYMEDNSLLMVLCSEPYDEEDYIRDLKLFMDY